MDRYVCVCVLVPIICNRGTRARESERKFAAVERIQLASRVDYIVPISTECAQVYVCTGPRKGVYTCAAAAAAVRAHEIALLAIARRSNKRSAATLAPQGLRRGPVYRIFRALPPPADRCSLTRERYCYEFRKLPWCCIIYM